MEEGYIVCLSGVLEEAKDAGFSWDELDDCLDSLKITDPVKKGCQLLNCVLFRTYPLLFLVALFSYPVVKVLQGSPCVVSEVTPFGEAMIPVMNCRYDVDICFKL